MDVVFASHHWPTWGRERVVRFLAEQRDLYAYLHDQTLRLLNQGLTGAEIAEAIQLPPALERAWHARGYYGSVSHNVKAIYQRYMGWYDGNPARLWQHPPAEPGEAVRRRDRRHRRRRRTRAGRVRGRRPALGGRAARPGDLRRPRTRRAPGSCRRETLEQLAYGAENGTWRNVFLAGATELRHGSLRDAGHDFSPDLLLALAPEQIFDAIAIRVDGPRAWDEALSIGIELTDADEAYRLDLRNGVLVHRRAAVDGTDVVLRLPRAALAGIARRQHGRRGHGGGSGGARAAHGRARPARPGLRHRDTLTDPRPAERRRR